MKEFADKITALVADGNISEALTAMFNLLALAASELKNDATILRGRLSKLNSDKRKGVLTATDECLIFNQISDGTLGLLDDMMLNAVQFNGFIKDVNDSASRSQIETIETERDLEFSVTRKQMSLTTSQKEALFNRMAHVKELNLPIQMLWVHDYPESNTSESRLITALGVKSVYAKTSAEAVQLLATERFDLVVSDIARGDNHHEGLAFLKQLTDSGSAFPPLIFYVAQFDAARGTPPFAFNITNRPNELLHLVMDIIERI